MAKQNSKKAKSEKSEKTNIRLIKDDSAAIKPKKEKVSKKLSKKEVKLEKKANKKEKKQRKLPKPIKVILTPFFAIGRYLRNSWRELRLVRWPNRKVTWKLTIAVIAYTVLVAVIIMLLDALFTFIFNKVLG